MSQDFYKTLGVSRDASSEDIQKAYRELARKHHPDLNPDDRDAKEKFQAIQEAYEVLNDPKQREKYDRYGSRFESMGGGGGGPGAQWRTQTGSPGFEDFDLSDLLGQQYGEQGRGGGGFADLFKHFTGGAGGTAPRRGRNILHELQIAFTTSITGGEARLSVKRAGGKLETITVRIPAGIEDGKKIRLRGQGEAAPRGGTPGDLLIKVKVGLHPHFQRHGQDLELEVPITLREAIEGAKVDVPTPKGTITLTVPPMSSSGKRLRVKGFGVQSKKGSAGDLYAVLMIVLPQNSVGDVGEFLDRLVPDEDPRDHLRW